MRSGSKIKQLIRHSFWLSILLHLLFFSTAVVIFVKPIQYKKPPQLYVPSYVTHGSIIPASQYAANTPAQPSVKNHSSIERKKKEATSPMRPNTQEAVKKIPKAKSSLFEKSVLAASLATLQQDQLQSLRRPQEEDPILLIGDTTQFADPLTRLIGRALSAHFNYPDDEGRLGIKGRVLIEMTLQPNGRFTNIRMVKSSDNHNLDSAALYAVNTAPVVEGADRFITSPKHMVIGFIFN